MATLDDKILGEKLEYYCSSDEGGEESDGEGSEQEKSPDPPPQAQALPPPVTRNDGTTNTGPKGVIKDFQRFKQLETEKREEQERERVALAQKLSLTCRSTLEDSQDPELDELLSDPFVLEYAKQRMQEMMAKTTVSIKFGAVLHLQKAEDYVDAVDNEEKSVIVVVFIWEEKIACCRAMADAIDELSQQFCHIKFCKISGTIAGVSRDFRADALPALLVYQGGQLIGNFIRLQEEFGSEFTSNDVSNYLTENGINMGIGAT